LELTFFGHKKELGPQVMGIKTHNQVYIEDAKQLKTERTDSILLVLHMSSQQALAVKGG